jgi:2-haloacid dehalogenase
VSSPLVVTFDLFSALIDSRTGGARAFQRLADEHGWPSSGHQLYDAWDARNKQEHARCTRWVPYRELAVRALAAVYDTLGVSTDAGRAGRDLDAVLASLPDWPLWPDVERGLPELAATARVGLLSNVDDDLFRRTAAAVLVDPELALTSERLRAYKPHPSLYRAARREVDARLGPLVLGAVRTVHVATSARDVRGALEAGVPVIRLRRPGHALDPDGPRPPWEAAALGDLAPLLAQAAQS